MFVFLSHPVRRLKSCFEYLHPNNNKMKTLESLNYTYWQIFLLKTFFFRSFSGLAHGEPWSCGFQHFGPKNNCTYLPAFYTPALMIIWLFWIYIFISFHKLWLTYTSDKVCLDFRFGSTSYLKMEVDETIDI